MALFMTIEGLRCAQRDKSDHSFDGGRQTVDYPSAVTTVISGINSEGIIVGYADTTGSYFTLIRTPVP
jgi:hypothetical protein